MLNLDEVGNPFSLGVWVHTSNFHLTKVEAAKRMELLLIQF